MQAGHGWGEQGMPYPFVVPPGDLRAHLIPGEHRDLADEVKVRTCEHMSLNVLACGVEDTYQLERPSRQYVHSKEK
jgi:hypothetical protein